MLIISMCLILQHAKNDRLCKNTIISVTCHLDLAERSPKLLIFGKEISPFRKLNHQSSPDTVRKVSQYQSP
jgi:hypothetical protein